MSAIRVNAPQNKDRFNGRGADTTKKKLKTTVA